MTSNAVNVTFLIIVLKFNFLVCSEVHFLLDPFRLERSHFTSLFSFCETYFRCFQYLHNLVILNFTLAKKNKQISKYKMDIGIRENKVQLQFDNQHLKSNLSRFLLSAHN